MVWTSTNKKDTKIIAIKEQVIYLCTPKISEIDNFVSDFKMNNIPQKDTMGIPFHYIKSINLHEKKDIIEIIFRDSTEEIVISDPTKKEEIFNYFRENIPGFKYTIDSYSKLRAGKKPLIATLVVLGLFIWSYYIAKEFERGIMYDVEGQHYNSIGGIILVLASLGSKRLILLFGCLLTIALIALFKKMKNPPVVRILRK